MLTAKQQALLVDLGAQVDLILSAESWRAASARLALAEAELRAVFEHSAVGVAFLSSELRTVYANPAIARIFGCTREEFLAAGKMQFRAPDPDEKIERDVGRLLRGEVDHYNVLRKYIRKDGREIFARTTMSRARNLGGVESSSLAMVAMVEDVTAQKLAEAALKDALAGLERRVEERTRELSDANAALSAEVAERRRVEAELRRTNAFSEQLFEASPDAIVVVDPRGRILRANPQAAALFGYATNELEGAPVEQLLPDRSRSKHVGLREKYLGAPQPRPMAVSIDVAGRRKDGTEFPADVTLGGFRIEGHVTAFAVVRDLTARRRAEGALRSTEEKLLQAQKMEAVGRLVAGVAHDFNNQLVVMLSCSEMALSDAACPATIRDELDEIRAAAERAAALTRPLLATSRPTGVADRKVISLNDVIGSMAKVWPRLLGAAFDVTVTLDPSARPVISDSGQLGQVLMNLVVNARDAMPSGGALAIETHDTVCVETAAPGIPPGRYAVLEVRDSGVGMAPETLKHLFEPFFTTKAKDKGTGLGLSIVQTIAREAGGQVRVSSAPGEGTRVLVYFPCAMPDTPAPSNLATTAGTRGSERILVVDDDDGVRRIVSNALRAAGYRVVASSSPLEAVALLAREGPVDALVSDIVMPRMRGTELYVLLRKALPRLRVLFMSGHAAENIGELAAFTAEGAGFVQKPFAVAELQRRLRALLDR